jgi:hypothetical protein
VQLDQPHDVRSPWVIDRDDNLRRMLPVHTRHPTQRRSQDRPGRQKE